MTGIVSPVWLTVLIVLPLVGAGLCLLLAGAPRVCRGAALATTLAVFAVALRLFVLLKGDHGRWLLLYADHSWIPRFGIRYTLGLDGLSLLLVLLTTFLLVIAILASWREIDSHLPFHYALLLLLETGVLGVFLSLDLVLFYIFWELMLIPMFFLIGVWGGPQRVYAAVKFFLFTFAGSLLMLVAILALYLFHGRQTGDYTFALIALQGTHLPAGFAPWLYGAFLLAFAIKVPIFPVHSWLPDVYSQGPSTVVLAGLLLETGVYGILRFAIPLFPEAARASLPLLAGLALVGIFYAAWIAYAQRDAKRLVAYSSVAHLGVIVLGLAAWDRIALEGSILQMVNHGITTGALIIMIGMIDERTKTRQLDQLGGLWGKAPVLGGLFLLFSLAALGLPGLNNFAGEILILIGAFQSHPLWGALAMGGVVFAAIYMLRLIKGVLWGPARSDAPIPDLTLREALILVPLAVLVFWLGLYPTTFLTAIHEPVQQLLHGLPLVALKGGMP